MLRLNLIVKLMPDTAFLSNMGISYITFHQRVNKIAIT